MSEILQPTISATYLARIHATPNRAAYFTRTGTKWRKTTFRQFDDQARMISFGLMSLGVVAGDRVAIISSSRIEWAISDIAILGAAAITIPISAQLTTIDIAYLLQHSEAKVALVEDPLLLEKVLAAPQLSPHLRAIVLFDSQPIPEASPIPLWHWEQLKEKGRELELQTPGQFTANLMGAKPDDLITITYTSGTTGIPKGVMLSHDNLMSTLEDCARVLGPYLLPNGADVLLSVLPFSHVMGKLESLASFVFGWQVYYTTDVDRWATYLTEVKPTLVFAVPRIFEKARAQIQLAFQQSPLIKRLTRLPGLSSLARKKIRAAFGGRLRLAICGGAPLPIEIARFFHACGIPLLEGYGLTETSAAVTLLTPEDLARGKWGSVGRPLPEVAIKIAADGEILVKSRKVFKGYYKVPEQTAATLERGWLKTGDVGRIDDEGYLTITDRKKDLIITSGGRNIAPQRIEALAKSYPLISQFVIVGDQRHTLSALVTLDREHLIAFATEHKILFSDYAGLIQNPKVQLKVQSIIDAINLNLASFEKIRHFLVLPREFTIQAGELTPSLKIRRQAVTQKYRTELDRLYGASELPTLPNA